MTPQIDSISAPHKCRWLKFKEDPAVRPSSWTEAVCVRIERQPRTVVPALDCTGCRHWKAGES
jgi:hypothetical protein